MKYCVKCGAELTDDAAFCSKCGSSFEVVKKKDRKAKVVTANILVIIAFCLSLVWGAFTVWAIVENLQEPLAEEPSDADLNITVSVGDDDGKTEEDYRKENVINFSISFVAFVGLHCAVLMCERKAVKATAEQGKKLTCLYMGLSGISTLILFLVDTRVMEALVCGFGYIFFVPLILVLISGISLLKVFADE